ncbi:MAG: bi-domain-containing oxidoreductase [Deltaproteobacteria bacterium]|nr:bi-domain-containing oxidoreductase [Deltaproteobacteria bacterium]
MRQLTQKLKDGVMKVLEVPVPVLQKGHVLVRNHYSLVSAGTEATTVRTARMSLFGKARQRPQQFKQVIDTLRTQGPVQTWRAVMKKLDAYSPLGYSCAGEVIAVAPDIEGFQVGDKVACGGLTAAHAEIVAVPKNLCVKLAPEADLRKAAYNTLGAISLQAVRQADLRFGESCAVIGLGLLGQLACLLLRASGVRVVGVDINETMVAMAAQHAADLALVRSASGIEERIHAFTGGLGCEAVIVAAASDSLDPINFAGAIARKRGVIVVLGAVPTGFDREPYFYRKELTVRMSCSYGPGRYDPAYEEKGIDYPPAYVRWTENRNMQAFQEALQSGTIDVSYLTTHVFPLEKSPEAYDMMMSKSEPFVGILIQYDTTREIDLSHNRIDLRSFPARVAVIKPEEVSIGFIGAGSYAQSHLLPNVNQNSGVRLAGVMTATGTGARSVGDRFGFEFCTGDEGELLENPEINAVFIATRHDTHAYYVEKALQAGKHVFVEKPLCMTEKELSSITSFYEGKAEAEAILMVGYNRRFSPLAVELKNAVGQGAMAANYRINAGAIPVESWIQDRETGGGRIIGEVCHFVDFLTYLTGSFPVSVYAAAMEEPRHLDDVVTATITFANGSIGTISYFSNGDRSLAKERIEAFSGGVAALLDDFKTISVYEKGRKRIKRLVNQDKGQREEVRRFIEAVKNGGAWPIPLREIISTSLVTFAILESLRTGAVMRIGERGE